MKEKANAMKKQIPIQGAVVIGEKAVEGSIKQTNITIDTQPGKLKRLGQAAKTVGGNLKSLA